MATQDPIEHIYTHMYTCVYIRTLHMYTESLISVYCSSILQGGKPKLQDGDAVLIGRSWFSSGEKITLQKITEECDEHGLIEVADNSKLREALIHLGNELVENGLVELKKPAGITRSDIVRLV